MSSFECKRCGKCCRWHGYVRLSDDEVDRIAGFLQLPVTEFIDKFTIITDDRRGLSLTEYLDGRCIFLGTGTPPECMIESCKPRQCRDFPVKWNFPGWENECAGAKSYLGEKLK